LMGMSSSSGPCATLTPVNGLKFIGRRYITLAALKRVAGVLDVATFVGEDNA